MIRGAAGARDEGSEEMPAAAREVFDGVLEKTDRWLKEIMHELGGDNPHAAYGVLRSTLHALRDRLTVDEAAQLGAQLPMLVRGLYYEGWKPAGKPLRIRHKDEFLARIEKENRAEFATGTEDAVRAVLRVLASHVTPGEIAGVRSNLPAELDALWP
jgi:uncharacterized protein (DUF2267 family)